MPYDDAFKRRRKLMQQALGPRSIATYNTSMEVETREFIGALILDPTNYIRHIRRYAGGLALSVIYGFEPASNEDKYLILLENAMDLFTNEMTPGFGIWPVDIFPFLQHIPEWVPGGSFKRKAKVWKRRVEEFAESPFIEAQTNKVSA